MRGDFRVFEMAAHTMTEEGFCCLKTLRVESGMSAEDFARTLLFCRLQIASTVNNFLSEKMISLVSVPAFNLLRRIFARASLVPVPAFNLLRRIFARPNLFFLEVCEVLTSLHFKRRHLQIGFNNVSDRLLTDIHVTGHCPHGSFGIASDSGSDSINHLWRQRRSWSSTLRMIFGTLKFFTPANRVVNS